MVMTQGNSPTLAPMKEQALELTWDVGLGSARHGFDVTILI
jgi:hypothetical protein